MKHVKITLKTGLICKLNKNKKDNKMFYKWREYRYQIVWD